MRILVIPTYEYPSALNADSSYLLTRAWIEAACKADPDLRVTWLLPEPSPPDIASHWSYRPEPMKCADQVELLTVPLFKSRDLNEIVFDRTLFEIVNPWRGSRPTVDAVITNNAGKGFALQEMMKFNTDETPPVIIWDFSTRFLGKCELDCGNEVQLVRHMLGYAMADRTWFQTEFARKQAIATARVFLAPALVDRIFQRTRACTIALNTGRLDPVIQAAAGEKFENLTCYFGGRFTATKGGEFAAHCYDMAFKTGRKVDIQITVPTSGKAAVDKAQQEMGEITWHQGLTQEEAWGVMVRSHMSLFPQTIKMLPASFFEQVYAGLAVVVNRAESDELIPDYPFRFTEKIEGYTLLREIVDDYAAAQAKLAGWPEKVKARFSVEANAAEMVAELHAMIDEQHARVSSARAGAPQINGYEAVVSEAIAAGVTDWDGLSKIAQRRPAFERLKKDIFVPGKRVSLSRLYLEARRTAESVGGGAAAPTFTWKPAMSPTTPVVEEKE